MDHDEPTVKDIDTVSPLYPVVLKEMVEQMHINGLSNASLPGSLLVLWLQLSF